MGEAFVFLFVEVDESTDIIPSALLLTIHSLVVVDDSDERGGDDDNDNGIVNDSTAAVRSNKATVATRKAIIIGIVGSVSQA